jgi:PX domain
VRRRYSEFASLRQTLVNLHPTLVIPPIPEKHTMADYAAKPTKAKEDTAIIELRKRMLAVFLNRCRRMKEVREDGVWWRFLDPNVSWVGGEESVRSTKMSTDAFLRARSCILIRRRQCRKTTSRPPPLIQRIQPLRMPGYLCPLHRQR